MKRSMILLMVTCTILVMAGIAIYFPAPWLPTNSDFSAMYNTDLALVNGVPIYDLEAVRAFAQPRSGIPDESFFLARFPYPPWYALSTFYLGFLSPSSAATLWFEMNLIILFLSAWLLTDDWPGRTRLFALPAAFLFLPVLGALIVGQYDFPVLLGTSLLFFGLKREKIPVVVLGAVLVTFKPHIGGLIFLFLLIWLFLQGNEFGRRSLKYIALVLCGLILSGFLADSQWISRYAAMLLGYQSEGNVTSCSECISLPMLISRGVFDGSLRTAILLAGSLLLLLAIFYYLQRSVFMKSAVVFMTAGVFATVLVSPYFYNYDFILLLVPFAVILGQIKSWGVRIILGVCYLAPYLALGLYGRNGNAALIVITLILYLLFYLKIKAIDVPAQPA
jgi:hypothetical protein